MINQLVKKIKEMEAPIVVGLDPMWNYIPQHIQKKAVDEIGETLEAAAEAVWQYNKGIVDAICDIVPAVKPQIAMYEQFGIPGLAAFKKTVDYCKQKGLIVIGDVKRGDIGSTSAAYATGHIGKVQIGNTKIAPFDEDFITVNPYLGTDGIKPFVDVCKEEKKGHRGGDPPVRPHHRAESGERPRCAEDLGRLPPCGRQGVRHGAGPDGGRHEDRQLRKCPDPV